MSDEIAPAESSAGSTVDEHAVAEPGTPATAVRELGDVLRVVVAAACLGAAVIHFAYAPSHFDEQTSHGAFFLVVAWAQVAVAAALFRWRRSPEPWLAAAAVNAGVLAVWLGSRTIGVPATAHDGVGLPDLLASSLEAVVVLGSVVALRPALTRRSAPSFSPLLGGAAAVALVGLVSASVTPSLAGEHNATADHGDHGGAGESAATADGHGDGHGGGAAAAADEVPLEDRCDLGFNTVRYNAVSQPGLPHAHDDTQPVDFTIEQWAQVFVDPGDGIPPGAVVNYLEDNPRARDGILSGGLTHTLAPDPWNPLTDPAECEQLAGELRQAHQVAARYQTVADAEAAGYRKVTPYYPGIAAHYIRFDLIDGDFELEAPEMLLYDGDGPTAHIVGLSYYLMHEGDEEPADGFTGNNDHYHRHVGLCFRDGVVIAGSSTSSEECAEAGGRRGDGSSGWMSHVWVVPGCESDWGVFSGANPALTVRGLDTTGEVPSGCGTGMSVTDDLMFDPGGEGPRI